MSTTTTYTVTGMTCGHCAQAVTAELTTLPGVRDVRVDVASGAVDVTSDAPLPIADVRAAVDEAGYALAGPDA
jgi:copper chaperone CopZ